MRPGPVALVACVVAAAASLPACVQKRSQSTYFARYSPGPPPPPPVRPVDADERPFAAMPAVAIAAGQQSGPMYRVQIVAEITRDVMPTDDLAIIIAVGDHEVGRYPIVGRYEQRPTPVKQEIELPLGDYEIEYDYKGTRYAGMPFRLAEVPVWGGRRAVQLRAHPGTRVSLRERKLWVGRWWSNDGPPQAWIVEWAHEGKVVTTTSGREDRGIPANASRVVGGAAGAFRSERTVDNTIWAYGEEYPLPDVVATKPGPWAARVVHGGSSPVAVVFNVLPGGKLAEASARRIHAVGWDESWSRRLEQRALSVTEVERLTTRLPQLSTSQPFDDAYDTGGPEAPVRISTAAVRALFRSRQLADAWWEFTSLNVPASAATTGLGRPAQPAVASSASGRKGRVDASAFPKGGSRKSPAAEAADRKAKLRTLRMQIESLIKTHGGAWKNDEFPRS